VGSTSADGILLFKLKLSASTCKDTLTLKSEWVQVSVYRDSSHTCEGTPSIYREGYWVSYY